MPFIFHREIHATPADDARAALHALAQSAQVSLSLLIYGLTDSGLADILVAQHAAGRTVEVVADHIQSTGKTQRALLQRLVDAGISVVITAAPSGQIAHTKLLLKDIALGATHPDSAACWGSYNFSGSVGLDGAEGEYNILEIDHSSEICAFFDSQYQAARAAGLIPARAAWQLVPTPTTIPPAQEQRT
jgi:hypothetical protein